MTFLNDTDPSPIVAQDEEGAEEEAMPAEDEELEDERLEVGSDDASEEDM